MTQKSELSDKDFKIAIRKIIQEVKANTLFEMNRMIEILNKVIDQSNNKIYFTTKN